MKNGLLTILLAALVGAVVAFGLAQAMDGGEAARGFATKETAFERVIRTNTLRCGYYVFPPIIMRDPNTNEMTGFSIDMMKIFEEKTGIKVEWTEESTFGNWISALQAKRYDVMCAPMWSDMALGRETIFTRPLFFAAIAPLVRADDTRFDGANGFEKLNSADTTFVIQEGSMPASLTKEVFPKAKTLNMPSMMDGPSVMQNVITGKADVMLCDLNAVIEYNRRNEVKLKILGLDRPLKAQPFVLPLHRKETELREFMDNAIHDMLLSGSIDRLLDKWEKGRGKIFLRVARPYELQEGR